MMYYAGIGSRETPEDILKIMTAIATKLDKNGYVLRSGGARGADTAFEVGASSKEIWIPYNHFNEHTTKDCMLPTAKHTNIASTLLPYWSKIQRNNVRLLHSRNVGQILGDLSGNNSKFVLCWTKDGAETEDDVSGKTGGTKTAIILADRLGIPVINMFNDNWLIRLKELLNSNKTLDKQF